MNDKVINIETHDNFKGLRGSLDEDSGIIKKEEKSTKYNPNYRDTFQSDEGVSAMEITQKEYIDQRIDSLEKSIDRRFDSTETLLSEKMDHLHTRIEASMDRKFNSLKSDNDEKFSSLKSEIAKDQKESKRFLINTTLAAGGIATAIIVGGVTIAITLLT